MALFQGIRRRLSRAAAGKPELDAGPFRGSAPAISNKTPRTVNTGKFLGTM
jgi:hypothetical protein